VTASAARVGRSYILQLNIMLLLVYIIDNISYSMEEEAYFPVGKTSGE
jgi:hypothetical protein